MKKVILNEDMCIGCGACVGIAEENFEFGEGHAVCKNNAITKEAEEAADCCPVGAISIEDVNE